MSRKRDWLLHRPCVQGRSDVCPVVRHHSDLVVWKGTERETEKEGERDKIRSPYWHYMAMLYYIDIKHFWIFTSLFKLY